MLEILLVIIGIIFGFPIGSILRDLAWVRSSEEKEIFSFRDRHFIVSEYVPSEDEKVIRK